MKYRALFVNNLPTDISDEELIETFGKLADIKEIQMIKHQETNENLGYGFIFYKTCHDGNNL